MEILLTKEIVQRINDYIRAELKAQNIANKIIRDDVFSILDRHCTILYYPLENESIKGYHISRHIGEETKDFVYINTAKTMEVQVFAAAHELGHILKIDKRIAEDFDIEENERQFEKIVSRFAAELLMPEKDFFEKFEHCKSLLKVKSNKISVRDIISIGIYLMNEYLVEFEAIIKRFYELEIISCESCDVLMKINDEEQFQDKLNSIVKANNFTRLCNITNKKSISNLEENISNALKTKLVDDEEIDSFLDLFDLDLASICEYEDISGISKSINLLNCE